MFTHEEKEGKVNKNPIYTIIQGIGLNRMTANFSQAIIDDAQKVTDI